MHKLVFKGEGLRKLIKWSEGKEKMLPYTNTVTKKMGLTLVKDEGIYVMASTTETFPKENGEEGSFMLRVMILIKMIYGRRPMMSRVMTLPSGFHCNQRWYPT